MTLTLEDTLKWLHGFDATVTAQKAYLSELDTPIGDGDHGIIWRVGLQQSKMR